MEILLLVVIGLIAKNFKAILEFISEQSQVIGVPPFQKDSETDASSFENKAKVYKLKSNNYELAGDLPIDKYNPSVSTTNETNSYLENASNDQNSNFNQNSDFDDSIIQLSDLKKGVIWQEILEPPRARRPYKII